MLVMKWKGEKTKYDIDLRDPESIGDKVPAREYSDKVKDINPDPEFLAQCMKVDKLYLELYNWITDLRKHFLCCKDDDGITEYNKYEYDVKQRLIEISKELLPLIDIDNRFHSTHLNLYKYEMINDLAEGGKRFDLIESFFVFGVHVSYDDDIGEV